MSDAVLSPALVSQPDAVKTYAGAGILDSASSLSEAWRKEDWTGAAVSGVGVGLDALGIVLDPLEELIKVGVGWAMEHFAFLREPLEVLTGDPDQIKAVSQSWEHVANHLKSAADLHRQALYKKGGCWAGEAAASYDQTAEAYNQAIQAVSGTAQSASEWIKAAGFIIATERAIIFDAIASFVSELAAKLVIAAASSVISMGGSLGLFMADALRAAASLMARIMQRLRQLLRAVASFVDKLACLRLPTQSLSNSMLKTSYKLRDVSRGLSRTQDPLKLLGKYDHYVDAAGRTRVASLLGNPLVGPAKEAVKSAEDNWGMEGKDPAETGE